MLNVHHTVDFVIKKIFFFIASEDRIHFKPQNWIWKWISRVPTLREKWPNTEFVFYCIRTGYGEVLRILSECGKIRTRKNSIFGHFSRSVNSANLTKTFKIVSVQNKIDIFFHEIKYLPLISFLCDDILLMIISFLSWWYSVIQQTSAGVNQNYANKWWTPDEKFLLNQ